MELAITPLRWLICSVILGIIAVLSTIWTPLELLLQERLRMRPGLPPYDWWLNPPDIIRVKMYLFNVTNADRFLSGEDSKLTFEEVGPIVYKMIVANTDVVFNENSTLSYNLRQTVEHEPNLSKLSMNATLFYPNIGVLMSASHFWNLNRILKTFFNYLLNNIKVDTIVKRTVYQILYDNEDAFLRLAHATIPSIVPINNVGLIPVIFKGVENRITVYMGSKYGNQKFFLLDKYNGSESIPHVSPTCKDTATGSGITYTYSQMVPKSRIVKIIDPIMCRASGFVYKEEVVVQGMKSYRFVQPKDFYNRSEPLEDDCYKGDPTLPDGLFDVSPCYFSFPVSGSNPHFLHADNQLLEKIDGMKPDVEKYTSYVIIEPISGVILKSEANLQGNLHMHPLKNMHKMFDKFSDMSIPLFYVQLSGDDLPLHILLFLRFALLLPYIGPVLSTSLLLAAILCAWIFKMKMKPKLRKHIRIREHIKRADEASLFIPRTSFSIRKNFRL